jgi:hypothetical protein
MLKFVTYPLYEVITDVGVKVSREIDQSSEMVGMCPNGFVLIIDNKKVVRETAESEPLTRLHITHPNEWQGWITEHSSFVRQTVVDSQILRLIAYLSLGPHYRKRLIEFGNVQA